jgi:hypothetical protein
MRAISYAGREDAELAVVQLVRKDEPVALVVVDTSTAFFSGEDENDNKQALDHAKWLRSISTRLPGNPTVLVCCHPRKKPGDDELVPRVAAPSLTNWTGILAVPRWVI